MSKAGTEIKLDGETVMLVPSLKAAQTISRLHGGILSAVNKVGTFDFDVISGIIAVGMGKDAGTADEIGTKVYNSGIIDLAEPVTKYLTSLANGGAGES